MTFPGEGAETPAGDICVVCLSFLPAAPGWRDTCARARGPPRAGDECTVALSCCQRPPTQPPPHALLTHKASSNNICTAGCFHLPVFKEEVMQPPATVYTSRLAVGAICLSPTIPEPCVDLLHAPTVATGSRYRHLRPVPQPIRPLDRSPSPERHVKATVTNELLTPILGHRRSPSLPERAGSVPSSGKEAG
ncbi:hypothetical protein AAFF_G00430490 [Aldrovandia affinis]|uniref:Uncharacterized protein n=1 Tax=Aldrovandia affinis TaxID=143900 RepID=A0AAD7WIS8_9TELE|nr:hypothetical protein AAFF_G00430490 [Aldrovandia affinis]